MKMQKKILKNSQGITLVALIVTIIVLLILAGVSINLVVGENGILNKAQNAVKENRKATAKEEIALAWAACEADYMSEWVNNQSAQKADFFTEGKLNENLTGKGTVTNLEYIENGTSTLKYQSNNTLYTMKIDENGNVEAKENADGIDQSVPSSFTIDKSEVGVNSFTLSATFEDNESGLGKIVWYYKIPEDENWQSKEEVYATSDGTEEGITGSVTKTFSVNDLTKGGQVAAYAEGYDVAGNSLVTTNATEDNPLTFNTEAYTISYNANNGSEVPESQEKYFGVDITLSSTVPTRSDYKFLGWSENSSATSATYETGTTYSNNSSTTLYAIWQAQKMSASYSVNRSYSGSNNYVSYDSDGKGIGVRTYISCSCSASTTVNTAGWKYITVSYSVRGDNGSTSANVSNGAKIALNGASTFSVSLSASAVSDGYNEAWSIVRISSITLSMN
jgi:uncharacterized repeat protein (TIGR02543 family)